MNVIQLLMQTGEAHYRTGIITRPDGAIVLAGIDFRPLDLKGVTAKDIVFDSCMFDGADMQRAGFDSCEFIDCTMDGARVIEAKFTACVFTSASMRDAVVGTTRFTACWFKAIDLEGANFSGCTFDLPRGGASVLQVNNLAPLVVLDVVSGPVAMLGHGKFEPIGRVIDFLARLSRQEVAESLGFAASYRVYEAALVALADAE